MNVVIPTEADVRRAIHPIQTRTPGVLIGQEIRVGRDHTDDEAVWVYVVVPDEHIDAFYGEWDDLRSQIRAKVREGAHNPDLIVYVRMYAGSELSGEQ